MATNQLRRVIETLRRATLPDEGACLTDGQLLETYVRSREEAAFATLVGRHGPMVWGVCRRVLGSRQDAEDAFQATFLVLVRKAASVVPRDLVANWLYGVAHRTALKARALTAKRRAREKQVTAMPEPALEQHEVRDDLQALLDWELSHLPDKYRAVIVLCDLEGRTRKEAARHFHLPEGTVASRLATGRAMLAKRLARHGLPVSGAALAALLAQSVASAGAPASVASATIKAASLFAAGPAAAPGLLSVKAVLLAEGVLKTMLLTKLKIAGAVLIVLAAISTGVAALAPGMSGEETAAARQQQLPGEKPATPLGKGKKDLETATVLSGILKAVNFENITVTVVHQGREDTFTVAQDAKVLIDGNQGSLAGLRPGFFVTLNLGADRKTARSIHAERPQVSGIVKAVDAQKNTLTIEIVGAEKTFAVARDAKVEVDGNRGTLAEMAPGARVTLGRVDPGTASSVRADGPGWRHVIVRAVDAAKGTITFGDHKSPVELGGQPLPLAGKTYPVVKDAVISIDGKPGRLSGVPPGALVAPVLTADQKRVRGLQAYGPGGKAWVQAVDAAKGTITFADDGKGPAGNSVHENLAVAGLAGKTLPVAKDADIQLDGKPGKLSALPPGARIGFGLSVDHKTVLIIQASGPGWRQVVVKAVDVGQGTVTFDDDEAPPELAGKAFPVAADADIQIDGKPSRLSGLPSGTRIDVGLSVDREAVRRIQTDGPGWQGVFVKGVDVEKKSITFDDDKAPLELAGKTFRVAKDADIQIDGKPGGLAGLPPGARISVGLSVDQNAVRSIRADGPGWQGVFVKGIDVEMNSITFDDDKAPAELAGKTFRVAKDADIQIDGKPGGLAGLPPGARISVGLSVDQNAVRSIRADGPDWQGVFVKEVDVEKKSTTFDDDKAPPELAGKAFPVAADADIQIDGKPGKLSGLPSGTRIGVGLSVDHKAVRSIRADGPAWQGVFVKAVDVGQGTVTFDDDKAPPELAGKAFPVAKDADIQIDGRPGRLAGLRAGVSVALRLSVDRKTVRSITSGP